MYWALIDIDNCYASCERVFHPELIGKILVILSNNDGCVVARSNEAKRAGITEGIPFYQLEEKFPGMEIHALSSNYELYGNMTDRVMSLVRQAAPSFYRYSIDEGFCCLSEMEHLDLKAWGEQLHQRILKGLGIPVSIGIAPTKTLAKMASKYAKRYPGYHHCCLINSDEKRLKALELFPLEDVWGIGRRNAEKLHSWGDHSALDFARHTKDWVRKNFTIVGLRTWMELNGMDMILPDDMEHVKKKSICTSRSFPGMIADEDTLLTHISNYAARCAEKLRNQKTVASSIGLFLSTNPFREDLPQYSNYVGIRMMTPTSSTQELVKAARICFNRLYLKGYQYKRAGVIVQDISQENAIQTSFIDYDSEKYQKMRRLDKVMDEINRLCGTETLVLGAQQYSQKDGKGKAAVFADAIKHDHRTKCPTTRWSDILVVK